MYTNPNRAPVIIHGFVGIPCFPVLRSVSLFLVLCWYCCMISPTCYVLHLLALAYLSHILQVPVPYQAMKVSGLVFVY